MTIDDVNYLYEHSVKDSFMLFIDSATRNRAFYPDPNEYVITFEEPLKLVYGLDILDAAMPNTMFNIDVHNNNVTLMIMRSNAVQPDVLNADGDVIQKVVDVTAMQNLGLTMHGLIAEQQDNVLFKSKFNSYDNFDAFIVDNGDWIAHPELEIYLTDPVDLANPPTNPVNETFIILVSRFVVVKMTPMSSIPAGGRSMYVSDPDTATFVARGETYIIDRNSNLDLLAFLNGENDAVSVRQRDDRWEVTVSRNIATPAAYGGAGEVLSRIDPLSEPVICFVLEKRTMYAEIGTYDINTLQGELQGEFANNDMYIIGTDKAESTDLTKQGRMMFMNTNWPFVFNMDWSTMYENLGFDSYAKEGMTAYDIMHFNDNKRMFASIFNVYKGRFEVKAPGNINLLGTRYVTLRCKEIEDHLSSSVTFNAYSTGIGLFKLQDVRDVTNLRFDFSTFLRKPFHPIGKLSRLTFKFETPRGNKYDFKGFNHNILISIKYLSPNMSRAFTQSSLNPNYDPDYLRYVTNLAHFAQVDEYNADDSTSSSDDEEGDDYMSSS